jgi:aspartyl-tRNA(Asn)/glutamyl-tRNA(Gln) amidotransferase subunit A
MSGRSATGIAKDLREGRLDAVELAERTLDAIRTHPDQAIFIDLLADRALREAQASRRRLRDGSPASALDGVPIGWKDLFDIEGRVTKAASLVLRDDPPARLDADLVTAAQTAGIVSVGALNMTEFAYSGIGINPHYGTPRNPNGTGPARAPGGSSSATGVVVAAGLLPLAIGTDTGGSVRIPASFNGVVGYKSSTGRYSMRGVFPLSRTLDTLGPIANTVADCALLDAVMRGREPLSAAGIEPGRLQLIVPTNVVFDGIEPAVAENFESALDRVARAGARVVRRAVPQFDALLSLIARRGHVLTAEALHVHWDRVKGPAAASMDPRVVRRILMAEKMTAVDLVEVMYRRGLLIDEVAAEAGDAFFAFPTTPNVAMEIAPLEADQEVFFEANFRTLRNTMIGNFLDWCGVQVPSGRDGDGMPTGFLLSATHGRDDEVLAAAETLEPLIRGESA